MEKTSIKTNTTTKDKAGFTSAELEEKFLKIAKHTTKEAAKKAAKKASEEAAKKAREEAERKNREMTQRLFSMGMEVQKIAEVIDVESSQVEKWIREVHNEKR